MTTNCSKLRNKRRRDNSYTTQQLCRTHIAATFKPSVGGSNPQVIVYVFALNMSHCNCFGTNPPEGLHKWRILVVNIYHRSNGNWTFQSTMRSFQFHKDCSVLPPANESMSPSCCCVSSTSYHFRVSRDCRYIFLAKQLQINIALYSNTIHHMNMLLFVYINKNIHFSLGRIKFSSHNTNYDNPVAIWVQL